MGVVVAVGVCAAAAVVVGVEVVIEVGEGCCPEPRQPAKNKATKTIAKTSLAPVLENIFLENTQQTHAFKPNEIAGASNSSSARGFKALIRRRLR